MSDDKHRPGQLPPIPHLPEPPAQPNYKAIAEKFAADSMRVLAELTSFRDEYKGIQERLTVGDERFERIENALENIKSGFYEYAQKIREGTRPPMLLRTAKPKVDLLQRDALVMFAIGLVVPMLLAAVWLHFLPL